MSNPATMLIALLFRAMLSTAAPRPRRARYTADTAFGRLVTTASTSPPVTMSATAYRRRRRWLPFVKALREHAPRGLGLIGQFGSAVRGRFHWAVFVSV